MEDRAKWREFVRNGKNTFIVESGLGEWWGCYEVWVGIIDDGPQTAGAEIHTYKSLVLLLWSVVCRPFTNFRKAE